MVDEPAQTRVERRSRVAAERRRKRMRVAGNVLLGASVAGLLGIVFYFVGTCAYTARQQDQLRDKLAVENPELAAAEASVSEEDFVSLASEDENSASTAAEKAAEIKRLIELANLRAAADDFALEVQGRKGKPIGRIVIPSIEMDVVMVEGDFEGASEAYLKVGPGHWPETPFPGQGGSFVASGHRTTWGAPFFKLNELEVGDEIELVMPYAIIRYAVTRVIVVEPDEMQFVADQGKEQVSLVACHPIYSAAQRIIAQGEMTSFVLVEPDS